MNRLYNKKINPLKTTLIPYFIFKNPSGTGRKFQPKYIVDLRLNMFVYQNRQTLLSKYIPPKLTVKQMIILHAQTVIQKLSPR